MRSIILKGRNMNSNSNYELSNVNTYKPMKLPSCKDKPFTKANLHKMLAELL